MNNEMVISPNPDVNCEHRGRIDLENCMEETCNKICLLNNYSYSACNVDNHQICYCANL